MEREEFDLRGFYSNTIDECILWPSFGEAQHSVLFALDSIQVKMLVWEIIYPGTVLEMSNVCSRVYSKCTRMVIMPILASEALLRENKKSSEKCYPWWEKNLGLS